MNAASLRVDSIWLVGAMLVFALVGLRARVRTARDVGGFVATRLTLDVVEGSGHRRFQGLCPLLVGRARDCDLVLGDPEVSRRHARFDSDGEVVYVGDAGSSNGTFLNGHRLAAALEVRPGDEIDVGSTRLVYVGSEQ
ncbi:MAG: FHA domain-containing protein [Vulcanimicrobiaceae bacterium]